ncbi:hypothetical protein CYY_002975 [Polysphondylium violaceum]|uniref:Uncharacterized protein n=1 Tax=Polysphondylium violaceum TaxID=133409 RepID=A0A8J4Q0F4_9MYCE|nr:hypothetical protein CYY_002975 [Polysphondylium violaceum]
MQGIKQIFKSNKKQKKMTKEKKDFEEQQNMDTDTTNKQTKKFRAEDLLQDKVPNVYDHTHYGGDSNENLKIAKLKEELQRDEDTTTHLREVKIAKLVSKKKALQEKLEKADKRIADLEKELQNKHLQNLLDLSKQVNTNIESSKESGERFISQTISELKTEIENLKQNIDERYSIQIFKSRENKLLLYIQELEKDKKGLDELKTELNQLKLQNQEQTNKFTQILSANNQLIQEQVKRNQQLEIEFKQTVKEKESSIAREQEANKLVVEMKSNKSLVDQVYALLEKQNVYQQIQIKEKKEKDELERIGNEMKVYIKAHFPSPDVTKERRNAFNDFIANN